MANKSTLDDLAIYIHWPYCTRICPYCDFNVYKNRQDTSLVTAICEDLSGWRQWGGPRHVSSIHFGGGTPSLLKPEDIAQILFHIQTLWQLTENCEIAIEANPQDANIQRWNAYAQTGITRMSLGVQSFHDPALKLLGRDHSGAQAKAALRLASEIFSFVSADLIYGWAGQTHTLLQQDLNILLSSQIGHISAYQLTIEDGTAFHKAEARGDIKSVNADQSAEFYEHVRDQLLQAGFSHYEVSNFAKPSHMSQHNLAYWQGRDYVGVGPGAHGRMTLDNVRYAAISNLQSEAYQTRIAAHKNGIENLSTLSPEDWGEEYVLMGLRIQDGISLSRYNGITGKALPSHVIDMLIEDGLLQRNNDRLTATDAGRLVLNKVTEMLLLTQ